MINAVPVFTDEDIKPFLDMPKCIDVIESCLRAKSDGNFIAPPRTAVAFAGQGELVFTIGGRLHSEKARGYAGFRVYNTFPQTNDRESTQLVAVWNPNDGTLAGLVLGELLGALRTGAIGGVAVHYLAKKNATICAVLGTGLQAEMQLLATLCVRPALNMVRVYSRSQEARRSFAERMTVLTGRHIQAVDDAQAAVEGADIVLSATNSTQPVFDVSWLGPDCHVSSLGPKLITGHELPIEIDDCATLIATDSPDQLHAYKKHFILGTSAEHRIRDLADIVAGRENGRDEHSAITLFCSTGLAGTEVAVADMLISSKTLERQ